MREKDCVQMPGKMARSDHRPSVRVTRGAGSGQHLGSVLQEAGKTRTLMPVWDSSGESRIRWQNGRKGLRSLPGRRKVKPSASFGELLTGLWCVDSFAGRG